MPGTIRNLTYAITKDKNHLDGIKESIYYDNRRKFYEA